MKKFVAIAVGIGVFLTVSNPSFTDHKAKIARSIHFNHRVFGDFASYLVPWSDLEFIDLFGFSLTQSRSKNTWVSIGAFGEIKVLDETWGTMSLSGPSR